MVGFRLLAGLASLSAFAGTTLHYSVEWRLIEAGKVSLSWEPEGSPTAGVAQLKVASSGMVARLYKVENSYYMRMSEGFCALGGAMKIEEGARLRETVHTYDSARNKGYYLERDLTTNKILKEAEVDLPVDCVHDVMGGLMALRGKKLEPGTKFTIPISDGKKFAHVDVAVQAKEIVETPLGRIPAIRCEVFLLNNVVYGRKGRLLVWFADDERKLPVQIRVRLQLLIGTITLQLTKEEKN